MNLRLYRVYRDALVSVSVEPAGDQYRTGVQEIRKCYRVTEDAYGTGFRLGELYHEDAKFSLNPKAAINGAISSRSKQINEAMDRISEHVETIKKLKALPEAQ